MSVWRSALLRRQVRVVIYVLIVLGLFLLRGPRSWRTLLERLDASPPDATSLTIAGRDLAPALLDVLTAAYHRDEPGLSIHLQGGGTSHALQALLDVRAGVAVLARPPRDEELALFAADHGTSVQCEPIALGALVLFAGVEAGVDSVTWDGIEALLHGTPRTTSTRIYGEDPNLGWWDALVSSFGQDRETAEASARVYFLADLDALLAAVRDDPQAIGLASSLTLPVDDPPAGIRILAVRGREGSVAVRPTFENIVYGRYPLLHRLYVACREGAVGQPAKFVTYVLSGRGQRRIERAGFLPARRVLREILLDDASIGAR